MVSVGDLVPFEPGGDDAGVGGVDAEHLVLPRVPDIPGGSGDHQVVQEGIAGILRELEAVGMARIGRHLAETGDEQPVNRIHLPAVRELGALFFRPFEEEGGVGADPDIHPFRDRLQVLLQPGPLIGVQADPVVPAAGEARVGGRPVEGVVEVDDVVEHDPVVLADVHRIIGRAHRVAVGPLGVVIDIGREGGRNGGPVVVMIAHHAVQGAGIAAGAQVVAGFGDVPVEAVPDLVMGEVAEVEQDDRPVGGAAGMDPFHVREGVGFEEPLVPEHGVVLDVDVGGK